MSGTSTFGRFLQGISRDKQPSLKGGKALSDYSSNYISI
jgi:hypothetical protein